jgi:hypothetical protein
MQMRIVMKNNNKVVYKNKRSYYAATITPTVKPVQARITEGVNEDGKLQIKLQTRELLFDESDRQSLYASIHQGISIALRDITEYLTSNTWENRLTIINGMIGTSDGISPYTFSYAGLYAIPHATWTDFLTRLPYPDVVEKINLSVHRHLFTAYNFAARASDPEIRHFRADACGKYHFLASCNDSAWMEMVDNGVIAKGKTVTEALHKYPYVTPLYLEKFSHCPSFDDFNEIGACLIYLRAKKIDGQFDESKLNEFIAALPSSKKEPEKFSEMISDAHEVLRFAKLTNESLSPSRVFYHARNNFSHFKQIKIDHDLLHDYYEAIYSDLIFPEIIRKFFEQAPKRINVSSCLNDPSFTNDLITESRKKFIATITEYVNIEKLISLQNKWHQNITVINSKKPEAIIRLEWHPLFPEQMIDDVTFTCLTTEKQLRDEGSEMNHCVGGYANACMRGNSHIIKVKTTSGERSTIELRIVENKISLIQNWTNQNKKPCDKILNATDELLNGLTKNEISLNPERGKINIFDPGNAVRSIYPYELTDQCTQELIYQAYKDRKVLPSFMMANDYKTMIEKNDLFKNRPIENIIFKR